MRWSRHWPMDTDAVSSVDVMTNYLRVAKTVAFLILNIVQIINMTKSTAYTVKNFKRRR